ncbi:MAG: PilZ domain-containing protein [Pyrinomonadaceae bacterium]
MTDERRREERVPLSLEVRWESLSGMHTSARISDISLSGCYVESLARVTTGESVELEVRSPTGRWLALRGEVVYQHPNVGFGLRFDALSELERSMVEQVVEYARSD